MTMGIGDRIIIGVDRVVNAFCVLVGILVLLISCYSLLDNYWQQKEATDDSLLAYRPSLDHPLDPNRLISPEQVAWLVMDDTTIDYPVMQAGDNIKYLNTNPYGEYRMTGSIFLDYRNAPDFSDGYSLIYGHHMVSGAMFGALDGYRDRAYFDAHRTGRLVTRDAVYAVHTFAVAHPVASDSTMFSPHGRSPPARFSATSSRPPSITSVRPKASASSRCPRARMIVLKIALWCLPPSRNCPRDKNDSTTRRQSVVVHWLPRSRVRGIAPRSCTPDGTKHI